MTPMKHHSDMRGGFPVAGFDTLSGAERVLVRAMRHWSDGPEGQDHIARLLLEVMGEARAKTCQRALNDVMGLIGRHGRRKLIRHQPHCSCVGADEAVFAHFIMLAATGEREDAMLVGSLLLRWMFSKDAGLIGAALGPFGLGEATVLADPTAAMGALIFNAVWRDSAFAMILLLAGLKSIPPELFAAARVDGAGPFMRFRRITVPLMRIPILITLVRLMIHFVNVLTFSLILTGGGPNNATQTLGLAMYRLGFVEFRLGEANALAILVFLFNIVLIAINLLLFRQRRGAGR